MMPIHVANLHLKETKGLKVQWVQISCMHMRMRHVCHDASFYYLVVTIVNSILL